MKLKNGFTLAELMLVLIVIAVVISLMFTTTKPMKYLNQKEIKTKYATVYDALNLATYDMVYKDETNPFIITDNDKKKGDTDPYQKLCKRLGSYINTESESCKIPALSKNVTYMKNQDVDFKTLTPNLVALNGVKFYFSPLIKDDKLPAQSRSYYNPELPDFTLQFFMVYVDLSGSEYQNRPHTIKYSPSDKVMPDVFAFAIIPTGDAIPMGLAEYDTKFLSVRLKYIENKLVYYSPYYSYRQAKHNAWGWYYPANKNIKFIKTLPYTYNDYVREILERNSTQLYDFNKDSIYPETYDGSIYPKCNPPAGTAYTVYDRCGLAVDTPKFGASH